MEATHGVDAGGVQSGLTDGSACALWEPCCSALRSPSVWQRRPPQRGDRALGVCGVPGSPEPPDLTQCPSPALQRGPHMLGACSA